MTGPFIYQTLFIFIYYLLNEIAAEFARGSHLQNNDTAITTHLSMLVFQINSGIS